MNASGLGHLFVVSGLHVGIVAMVFTFCLLWLQRPLLLVNWRYGAVVAVAVGLFMAFFYAYISGFNVPALRACIMLFFAAFLILQKRHSLVNQYLLLAFISVILITPLAFTGMGSWLSFGIVGALVLGLGYFKHKPLIIRLLSAQWLAFCAGGVILLAFGLGLAPLGFFLNLLFIPLVTFFILPMALVALLLGLAGEVAALNNLESLLTFSLNYLLAHKDMLTWGPPVHDGNRYLLLLAMLVFLMPRAMANRMLAIVMLGVALFIPLQRPQAGGFSLMVLDVGQGSSALIETQSHSILVDTGSRFLSGMTLADYVVLPFLRQRHLSRLDVLHLTHDDMDHSGARQLLASRSRMVVDQLTCNEKAWDWDGVHFERFKAVEFDKGNNGSCLLKVTDDGGHTLLMSGDIEAKAEQALLKSHKHLLPSDVLLVPHHGSNTSTTSAFLMAVSPKVAIISAGKLNRYGHPARAVLQRLGKSVIEVYTTALNGAVQVDFEPRQEGLSVSTYRPDFVLMNNR